MRWLAIDTATDRLSVAVGTSSRAALEEHVVGARRHASTLLPVVRGLLERGGLALNGLRGVVVSDGPGSFTGLRVGAAVAKALAYSRGLEVRTAPSLMVRAMSLAAAAPPSAPILAIANALRGEIYGAVYAFEAGRVATVLAPSVGRADALISSVPRPERVVGDGPSEVLDRLAEWTGSAVVGPPDGLPRAVFLLDLIAHEGGARIVDDVQLWEPEYGRPAEAQVRWEHAHGRPLADSAGGPG